MEDNNKYWDMLHIEGNIINREMAIAFLNKEHCGTHELDKSSKIYFMNPNREKIESIINKADIKKWSWNIVYKENWNKKWKPFFKEIIIEDRVIVIPSWKDKKIDNEKILIKIDPGMAFGTGHHETTYMMIKSLLKFFNKGNSVMDIGTGSGILSILANKLGCNKIRAIDNDRDIKSNFNLNQKLNNCSIDLEIKDCLDMKNFNYDIILANINKAVLIKLIPNINFKNSILIISGVLINDLNHIYNILNNKNFKILDTIKQKEWTCIIAQT